MYINVATCTVHVVLLYACLRGYMSLLYASYNVCNVQWVLRALMRSRCRDTAQGAVIR